MQRQQADKGRGEGGQGGEGQGAAARAAVGPRGTTLATEEEAWG
jgi:hypothetical protein